MVSECTLTKLASLGKTKSLVALTVARLKILYNDAQRPRFTLGRAPHMHAVFLVFKSFVNIETGASAMSRPRLGVSLKASFSATRQVVPQAARCFGQPRPISRLGHAGRPHQPYFPDNHRR